ncbi:MAG TPA: SDR family NAD(P)-dependent oxidoreductase [Rubrivivax sp.]|nr:SDR family NAD(P)-dependent oxidoreductase [Rubrivivax sp.]HPO17736.1 SDR family NAD(P)-dependent oxidoreductase [Rubrivivax sp.]
MSNKKLHERYGPCAMVIGAAEGMGAAWAERLAKEGFDLVLLDLREPELNQLAGKLESKHGIRAGALCCDLTKTEQVQAALDRIAGVEIGLVVFNAALASNGPWAESTLADKMRVVAVNVHAVLMVTDALSRPMLERKRGGIVLTSSMAALQGAPGQAIYAATKSFDLILAESLWGELSPHGVDVMAFIPGMVRTPNFERSGANKATSVLFAPVEPAAAVEDALAGLGNGPRVVPGKVWKAMAAASSFMPRDKLIEAAGERMRGLENQGSLAKPKLKPK